MDSDESGHSESEFYSPEEEALKNTTLINCDEVDFIYSLRPENIDLNIW